MVGIKLQRKGVEDIPEIRALAKEIWLPTFEVYFAKKQLDALFQGMYSREKLEEWFGNDNNHMFTIISNDGIIGYLGLIYGTDKLRLDKIYIHPRLQRKGFGAEVLKKVEKIASDANLKKIDLRVNRSHTRTINFYKKQNFKVVRSIDFPAPDGYVYDDYLMEKKLD